MWWYRDHCNHSEIVRIDDVTEYVAKTIITRMVNTLRWTRHAGHQHTLIMHAACDTIVIVVVELFIVHGHVTSNSKRTNNVKCPAADVTCTRNNTRILRRTITIAVVSIACNYVRLYIF